MRWAAEVTSPDNTLPVWLGRGSAQLNFAEISYLTK